MSHPYTFPPLLFISSYNQREVGTRLSCTRMKMGGLFGEELGSIIIYPFILYTQVISPIHIYPSYLTHIYVSRKSMSKGERKGPIYMFSFLYTFSSILQYLYTAIPRITLHAHQR